MLTPASISVANWREKTWSDFGETFLKPLPAPVGGALRLGQTLGQQSP